MLTRAERARLRALAEQARDAEAAARDIAEANGWNFADPAYHEAESAANDANMRLRDALTHPVVLSLLAALDEGERDTARIEWIRENATSVSDGYGPDGELMDLTRSTHGRVRLLDVLPTVPRETEDWTRAALDRAIDSAPSLADEWATYQEQNRPQSGRGMT
jgi:hypothetical protein